MRRNAPGVTKYTLLSWVRALNDGYRSNDGVIQPPTLSNLAHFIISERALVDYFEKNVDDAKMRRPVDRSVHKQVKLQWYGLFRDYYGDFHVAKKTVSKTDENHPRVRNGHEKKYGSVTAYTVTKTGKDEIGNLEDRFEWKEEKVSQVPYRISEDTVKVPEQTRTGWELTTVTAPRIINGEAMDSDVLVYTPSS